MLPYRMMSTESANSFTLIGEASDGGTMENLSRRLKVKSHSGKNVNSIMSVYFDHVILARIAEKWALVRVNLWMSLILSHPGDQ